MILNFLKKFERIVILTLVIIMSLVIVLSVIEMSWTIAKDIINNFKGPLNFMVLDNLLEIFGLFLLILIGVELMVTMKTYLQDNIVHVETILLLAIIAVARKAIVLDLGKVSGITIMSLGVIIIALATGYFIVKKTQN